MDFMTAILSFVAGGSLFKIYHVVRNRRADKLDTATRIINFYQHQAEDLIKRVETIEKDVLKLKKISCIHVECTERMTTK